MLELFLYAILGFFAAFGFVEFIRFVYTDWNGKYSGYYIVIPTKNHESEMEGMIRNAILTTDSAAEIIVLDHGCTAETRAVLENLRKKYSYITICTYEEYIDFLNSKEC